MRRSWRTLWNTSMKQLRPLTTIRGVSVSYDFITESSLYRTMRPMAWRRYNSTNWWTSTKYQNINNTDQVLCLFPCRTRRGEAAWRRPFLCSLHQERRSMMLSWLRCPLRLAFTGKGNRLKVTRYSCFIYILYVIIYAMNKLLHFVFFSASIVFAFFLQDWSNCVLLIFGEHSTAYLSSFLGNHCCWSLRNHNRDHCR